MNKIKSNIGLVNQVI